MSEVEQVETARRLRPAPVVTDDNAVFWDAARNGKLVVQRCSCGHMRHPPRPICARCHSTDWTAEPARGDGVLYSYALLHHPQNPAFEYPIVAALVDLPEGVRVVSQVVDAEREELAIGMRLRVTFRPTAHEMAVPVFVPERSA